MFVSLSVRATRFYVDAAALGAREGTRLFFGGEATRTDYPSTVHGALLSGAAEAQRIINARSSL